MSYKIDAFRINAGRQLLVLLAFCDQLAMNPAIASQIDIHINFSEATPLQKNVYGVNNEWVSLPYTPATPQFIQIYKELGTPAFRYPAGTASNYLNLDTGIAEGWQGMAEGNAERVTSVNSALKRSGKAKSGINIDDYIKFLKRTGAVSNYILNVSSMTLEDNRKVLTKLSRSSVNIQHFELGNELYHGTYATAYPTPQSYLETARKYVHMVKSIFPEAKVAVVAHPYFFVDEMDIDGLRTSSKRLRNWYEVIKSEDFFDAVAVHMYAYIGMDHTTKEMLPYSEVYANACLNSDQTADLTLERLAADFPGKEIWVTEYHVGGFSQNLRKYRLRHSYLGALYNTGFMLRLFAHPEVTLSSWHAIPQWLVPRMENPSGLMQPGDSFSQRVTYHFFKLFNDPVKSSTGFVPVDISREGASPDSTTFEEFQAGLFMNNDSGISYLMVLNKQGNDSSIDVAKLEKALSAKLVSVSSLNPSDTLNQEEALTSESAFKRTKLTQALGESAIPGYSATIIKFQVE